MWCATSGCSGLIWMDVTQVSLVKLVGMVTDIPSTALFLGAAGTSITGPSRMMSGWMAQASGQWMGAGASFASPSGAPESAHFAITSISDGFSERSLVKCPTAGSANQGGILRESVAAFMALAQGRTLCY